MTPTQGSNTRRIEQPDVQNVEHIHAPGRKKIWVDLDNSPHVPFFVPIVRELEQKGYSVLITARNAFQVFELADLFHLPYKPVGHHYGKNKVLKICGTLLRSMQLLPIIRKEKPTLAIAHGSRSMCVACWLSAIPYLEICDYEFIQFLPGVHPTWLLCPDVIPNSSLPIRKDRILKYPGIKEDIYVPTFTPDESIKALLGFNEEDVVVTLRPPANEAHYYKPESDELFRAAVEFLAGFPGTKMVLLPRTPRQGRHFRAMWPDLFLRRKILIPEQVINGLNLIWFSDLVISGGGTMNREAAALGVPVYSVFRGRIGAVDQYLSDDRRLVLLRSVEDVRTKIVAARRTRPAVPAIDRRETLTKIVNDVITIFESGGRAGKPPNYG